ncbi:peptidoglycan glycosyltransferase/peptidoglycan DD-transpeptidase MrcA [Salmonella enterica subsp. enterica serovar Adjame]|uniref:peptidoglycan glycosyltransferase/peptidoglycan DD-transpeptidase MrcA n=1 Tax=Salmonella enterica TaxID=28901 RepID=UPI00158529D5|nr:peptidoglycan glycosyltransferase/peptidoglycan DD-transpeptidase MrcA [Salmonella enterica]EFT2214114.1 peptidoglycan glycosyltransferase/peptidoglycan DD-transpeptidase MrcA [Salmonella enterica subsp. enterica serovar Adjame]EHM7673822.1 peptidoglycan glycosyltransferase/peptidoglycan DD-transpeptidase MrcA [Salmonella enterica subsp. enterica serovar Adjame]EIO9971302.1 peptidoglycan glycosyltransferase/peptidoglycan DD-transpeptidase MrcA [Salmonella enterica subsp. enterica serovar Adja
MKFVKYLLILAVCCILLGAGSIYGLYRYIEPQLPDVATLKDVRLQIPMQVYSADGELIAQYGEKRRIPVTLDQIPPEMINAFIATEDSRFYEHHGIDPVGIFRAASVALFSGHASQGASTITQQLARNFFLSPERTLMRKIKEAFLAIRIEQLLNKNEILELYLNKIYLGYRAYGVGAAAQVYFGKTVDQLSLSEMAVIAGLPKAPSTFNPLYSMDRAIARRNVVLSRMLSEGYITQAQYDQARSEPIDANYHAPEIAFSAPYLSEMVRQEMYNRYGESAYEDGYRIYTTITRKVQQAAQQAVRNNVLDYDMRHGYRGPANVLWKVGETAWDSKKITGTLKALPTYGPLLPAVVTSANPQEATAALADGTFVSLHMEGMRWARPYRSDTQQGPTPRKVTDVVQTGQQIWVRQVDNDWWLAQVPEVNSALVSLNPQTGAVLALVGGFDFNQSKFNRATQALRQVGSNIKPFLYTAAMDKGLTLASMLNDVPISRWDAGAGSDWRPKNSPPQYAGPIRLRQGLGQSKNVVMVRAMRAMGVDYAAEYLQRFGFPAQNIVHTESLALGSASFTPMQVARGYAVMANGGFLIDPYFISKIENDQGGVIFEANPKIACPECDIPVIYGNTQKSDVLENTNVEEVAVSQEQQNSAVPMPELEQANQALVAQNGTQEYAPHVINTPLAFLIKSALNTNIFGEPGWMGTGWRAARDLKRRDIGGKTGTTNSSKDAWFSGYGPGVVTSVWIGFDDHRRDLGRTTASGAIKDQISGYEGGAKSAQPAWDAYMKAVLEGVPEQPLTPPPGIVTVNIDRSTGQLASGGNSREEYFIEGTQPTQQAVHEVGTTIIDNGETHELF